MNILATICAALSLDPVDATRLACRLERYEPCSEVLHLVAVESRGVAVGVHTGHWARVSGGATIRRLRVLRDRYGLKTEAARAEAWRTGVGGR